MTLLGAWCVPRGVESKGLPAVAVLWRGRVEEGVGGLTPADSLVAQ